MVSLVRGPWEVRLSRMIELAPGLEASDLRLRFSGWPTVAGDGLTSQLTALSGQGTPGHLTREQASPLGPGATVPTLTFSVQPGRWVAVLVTLTGAKVRLGPASLTMVGDDAVVTWPDGNTTCTPLPGEVQ
ncbi:MAG: hypothetical protein FWG11_07535 [Promicromonosporaceae bacterium]|nr:hypothetical protein [Promicromonosporaceae bacterium]